MLISRPTLPRGHLAEVSCTYLGFGYIHMDNIAALTTHSMKQESRLAGDKHIKSVLAVITLDRDRTANPGSNSVPSGQSASSVTRYQSTGNTKLHQIQPRNVPTP